MKFLPIIFLAVIIACKSEPVEDDSFKNFVESHEVQKALDEVLDGEQQPANAAYKPHGEFTTGTLKGRTYQNSFFGFTFEIPDDWQILTEPLVAEKMDNARQNLSTTDRLEQIYDESESNWKVLLSIRKSDRLPTITIMAEDIVEMNGVNSAVDYLEYSRTFVLENYSTGYPNYTNGEISSTTIAERRMLMQLFEIEEEHTAHDQLTWCAQFNNFIFTITAAVQYKEQEREVIDLLNTIKWD